MAKIIRTPKKLRDDFQEIRNGNVQKGLAQLDAVEGFEPQKDIARAEIAYFSHDWRRGLDLARSLLAHPEAW